MKAVQQICLLVVLGLICSCGSSNEYQIQTSGLQKAKLTVISLKSGETLYEGNVELSGDATFSANELGIGLDSSKIKISRATYVDAQGQNHEFKVGEFVEVIVNPTTNGVIHVNPLTTLASCLKNSFSGEESVEEKISKANAMIAEEFGLTNLQTTDPSETAKYDLLVRSLDELAKDFDMTTPALTLNLCLDIQADGQFDDPILKEKYAEAIYRYVKSNFLPISDAELAQITSWILQDHDQELFSI